MELAVQYLRGDFCNFDNTNTTGHERRDMEMEIHTLSWVRLRRILD